LFYGLVPGLNWISLIPVIFSQLLLTIVAAAAVAMIIPFARDLTNLIPTGLQFVMFISAVFYSTDIVPEQWRTLFFLNPMATLLEQYRLILLHQTWPDWQALTWLTLGCCIGLVALLLIYRRLAPVYPRVVIE
jgi:lipopolysaccharide transport system permease protein